MGVPHSQEIIQQSIPDLTVGHEGDSGGFPVLEWQEKLLAGLGCISNADSDQDVTKGKAQELPSASKPEGLTSSSSTEGSSPTTPALVYVAPSSFDGPQIDPLLVSALRILIPPTDLPPDVPPGVLPDEASASSVSDMGMHTQGSSSDVAGGKGAPSTLHQERVTELMRMGQLGDWDTAPLGMGQQRAMLQVRLEPTAIAGCTAHLCTAHAALLVSPPFRSSGSSA